MVSMVLNELTASSSHQPWASMTTAPTDINTSPCALPTLVTQVAVPAAAPCNFLTTFLVESIFKIRPYMDVAAARSCGSLARTSLV